MSDKTIESAPAPAEPVDGERRSALLAMASGLAYVPPAVATFAMAGLSIREAHAYVTNVF